jgi:hypothetical protein
MAPLSTTNGRARFVVILGGVSRKTGVCQRAAQQLVQMRRMFFRYRIVERVTSSLSTILAAGKVRGMSEFKKILTS